MVNSASDPQPSGRNPTGTSSIGMAQRSACDRCRGQKLRCTRNYETQASCNRCQRVGAQCIVGLLPRMGRPVRLDNPTQKPRERSDIVDAPTDPAERHSQPSRGLNDFYLPTALETQHQADSVHQSCVDTYDMTVSDLEQHDTDFLGFISFSNGDGEIASNASPSSPLGVDPSNSSKLSSASHPSCLDAQNGVSLHPLDPALTSGPQESAQNAAPSSHRAISTKSQSFDEYSLDTCQVSLDQLSRLNLELHRHLNHTRVVNDLKSAQACITSGSFPQDLDSLLPIGFMIRKLQNFQDLLKCSSTLGHAPSSSMTCRSTLTSRESSSTFDDNTRSSKRLCASHSSSTRNSRGFSSPVSPDILTDWTRSSSFSVSDASQPFSRPKATLKSRDRKQIMHTLDLPTRMLFVTCYINLTRFCRRVVSNIRQCLVTFDQEIIFARLSDLLISGVSLEQDGHLQIFVLIEIISRMLDVISAELGYSKEYSILAGNSRQGDLSSKLSDEATTPNLMESVMKEEELSEAQDVSGGGIKALQEEIWELKKLLQ